MHSVIRAFKGLYMFVMFAVFGAVIWLEAILAVPWLFVIEKVRGPNPLRMQSLNRLLFAVWLKFLFFGGLLHAKPFRGTIPTGPFVVVANHPGLFDVLVLIRDIPNLTVLVKGSLVRRLPLSRILRASNYVVVSEQGGFSGMDTPHEAIEVIKSGYCVMLFPEGTRSPKNGLLHFRAGAFKISQRANVPVLPIMIKNTPPFLPHEDRWYFPLYRLSRLEIEVWDPIAPPAPGQERQAARELEQRYRRALNCGG
jgi:1-acyl-sn-glycerol-3-phosphate acyltransferase